MTIPGGLIGPMTTTVGGVSFPEVIEANPAADSAGDTTSHVTDMPATVDSGDLLMIIFSNDGSGTVSFGGSFTEIFEKDSGAGNEVQLAVAYKQADGTEGGTTVTVTTGNSEEGAWIVYRIIGHVNPATQAPEISVGAIGVDDPDPDSLTPTGGSKKYLWLAVCAVDEGVLGDGRISAYPTDYTNGQTDWSGGSNGAVIGGAERQLEASSEDPGVFTDQDTSQNFVAATIAIHPA